jgi:hypothetical protein
VLLLPSTVNLETASLFVVSVNLFRLHGVMSQRNVALKGSAVITSDARSPGSQYNIYVSQRLATFVLCIAACSTNSRMYGLVVG